MCPDASASSGDGEIRTLDPLLARQVLSQLSYTPTRVAFDFACSPHGSHTRDQMLTDKFPSETWLLQNPVSSNLLTFTSVLMVSFGNLASLLFAMLMHARISIANY